LAKKEPGQYQFQMASHFIRVYTII